MNVFSRDREGHRVQFLGLIDYCCKKCILYVEYNILRNSEGSSSQDLSLTALFTQLQ